jgi:HAMP domain-containing protein
MRIFTQNMTSILPVFVALGVISGTLMYLQLLREDRWGLEQAAKSYSIATVEYTDPAAYVYSSGDKSNRVARRELNLFIRRLVEYAKVRAVFAWQADGKTLVDSTSSSEAPFPFLKPKSGVAKSAGYDEDFTVPPPTEAIRQELIKKSYYIGPIEPLGASSGRILAYAVVRPTPIHTRSPLPTAATPPDTHAGAGNEASATATEIAQLRRPVGIVGVNVDASDYVIQVRVLLERVVAIAATIIAIGFVLAAALSRLIVRDVRSLTAGAAAIARGELAQSVTVAHIQELSDLGGTFNIMVEILQNVVAKTRRSLVEGELFRAEAELASAFAGRYRPPLVLNLPGNVHLVASLCGDRAVAARTFFAVISPSFVATDRSRNTSESGWSFVGCLVNGKNLDAAMTASAAEFFISGHLASLNLADLVAAEDEESDSPLDRLFGYTWDMFGTRRLMICGWDAARDQARIWRFDRAPQDETGDRGERTVTTYSFTAGGPPLLLHDFDRIQGEQIRIYADYFMNLPLNELLNDIQRIVLPVGSDGGVLLLRRATENDYEKETVS